MKLVEKEISLEELKQMSTKMFGEIVKAVIDIEKAKKKLWLLMHRYTLIKKLGC